MTDRNDNQQILKKYKRERPLQAMQCTLINYYGNIPAFSRYSASQFAVPLSGAASVISNMCPEIFLKLLWRDRMNVPWRCTIVRTIGRSAYAPAGAQRKE
jgi:hypothetical protein